MRRFALTADAVAATAGRIDKIALVAAHLRDMPRDELAIAATFWAGRALPASRGALNLGGRQLIDAARGVWHVDRAALYAAYDRHGDAGAALADISTHIQTPRLFSAPLTLGRAAATFERIARSQGSGAASARAAAFSDLLADAEPLEVKYLVKLVTGDLRIGFKEALVVDAIAGAFKRPLEAVRRAYRASGDIGLVALLAHDDKLADATPGYGRPIAFMLASPIRFGGTYGEIRGGRFLVEDKYDGIRLQAHVDAGGVRLFSRRQSDVTHSYPEIAGALAACGRRCILDGELLAWRDGRALPFSALQARLQRKEIDATIQADVPLAFLVFDMLADEDVTLLDLPLHGRRARLEASAIFGDQVRLSPGVLFEAGGVDDAVRRRTVEDAFAAARERGDEGIVVKAAGSPYLPGRRGKHWFKLKRELATLDCVVVAVEYGHGKRNAVLSDYTFAVWDDGALKTIGKAYSGLTDAEIAEQTTWFLAHALEKNGRRIVVQPEIVVEIAFDIVRKSTLHESGYALRFPRIVRLRPDKGPRDASTLDEVRTLASA